MNALQKLIATSAMALISLSCTQKFGDFRDLTPTPPMGWNSWDAYGVTVTEQEVRDITDYMAENLLQYGWEYVVVDGAWNSPLNDSIPRTFDEYGRDYPAINRFPSSAGGQGFKPLADYIHSKGMKFGLHKMRGIPRWMVEQKVPIKGAPGITADMIASERDLCAWSDGSLTVEASRPGAQEYYNSLFELYAQWGVDFVKYDDLSAPIYHGDEVELIRNAIEACGRPMVLSTSPGETPVEAAPHLRTHANMWRTVNDVWDHWFQIEHIMEVHEKWYPFIGDGCWPDCDMLPIGRLNVRGSNNPPRQTRLTPDEQLSTVSFFSIVRSPLIFGGDILSMDPETLSLLTNPDIIEMNQRGRAPRQVRRDSNELVVSSDAPGGGIYAAVFNLSAEPRNISVALSDLGIHGKRKAKDLWSGITFKVSDVLSLESIPSHGCRVVRIK